MKCAKCNNEIPEGYNQCPYCNEPVGQPQPDNYQNGNQYNASPQVTQGNYNSYGYGNPQQEEKANIWLAILSFLVPVAGLIIYLVDKDKKPKTAKVSGKCALVSFILNVLISIGVAIFSVVLTGTMFSGMFPIIDDLINEGDVSIEEYDSDYSNSELQTFDDEETSTADDEETSPAVENKSSADTSNNSKWDDYIVYIDGVKIQLPCSWNDFKEKTGFDFQDSEDATSTVKSNAYTMRIPVVKDSEKIYVQIINDSSSQKTNENCKVAAIHTDDTSDLVFAGGLKIGNSVDEDALTKLLGTPDDIYNSDELDFKIYYYRDDESYYNEMEIDVSNGNISCISLKHFDY